MLRRLEHVLLYTTPHTEIARNFRKTLCARAGAEHEGKREKREMYFLHVRIVALEPYSTLSRANQTLIYARDDFRRFPAPGDMLRLKKREAMQLTVDVQEQPRVIHISGDVDYNRAPELAQIENELAGSSNVVLDVGDVKYVDTTFLRFLLRLRTHSNKSTRESVRLMRATRRLRRLLEVTGLSRTFAL